MSPRSRGPRRKREEGAGLAQYCSRYEMGRVHNPVQILRMVGRLPTPTPSSMGYFYSPQLGRGVRAMLDSQRFDLIFVHCSSVAQYVEGVRGVPKILDFGDMDSQKWLDYARSSRSRSRLATLSREESFSARRSGSRPASTCAPPRHARSGETLEGYGTGVPSDWFPNGVDSEYFAPTDEVYDPDTIAFVGRMDYYPNQECMFDFCAGTLPLLQARRPQPQAADRRRRPVFGCAEARETPGGDGYRIGARRAALSCAVPR